MLPLAKPTFTGIPDDVVKKIDTYANVGTKLQNALASKVSAFDSNLGGIIHKSLTTLSNIGNLIKEGQMNLNEAKEKIQAALGGSRAAISDIASTLEQKILVDMMGVDVGTGFVRGANAWVDSAKIVIDGVQRTFINQDYKSVTGVVGFIKDLTGNQLIDLFDLGAQAALVKGILTEVVDWGIPELIDESFGAKWNKEKNSYDYTYDDTFRFSVTKRASDSISGSTNLSVINQLMIHAGDSALVAENPNFPLQLLTGYVIPEGCVAGGPFPVNPAEPYGEQTKLNYAHQAWLLLDILNRLQPGWFYTERVVQTNNPTIPFKKDTVWNLQYLPTASEGAKTVLSTNSDIRSALLAAPFYRVESGIAMIKQMYPYFVE